MRKAIALSLLAIFLFTTPAMADTTGFNINNVGYSADTIVQDGSIYVPIRFVAEKMGYQVEYVNGEVKIKEVVKRPSIYGDDKFIATVNSALDLLEQKDTADYLQVCENTEKIWVNENIVQKEGFTEYAHCNGVNIAFTKEFLASEYYNVYSMAGALVHESCHEAWYKVFKADRDKKLDEIIAHTRDLTALQLIGAPQKDIDLVEKELRIWQSR